MSVEVVLPRVDMAMDQGSILAWKVAEGDTVRKGDLLFEMSTDKATMEVEAPASGIVSGIAVGEGIDVPVGTIVAHILAPGETVVAATVRPIEPEPIPAAVVAAPADRPIEPVASTKRRATPMARRLARQSGIDLETIKGTGPRGRVGSEDVQAARARGSLAAATFASAASGDATANGVTLRSDVAAGLFFREWTPEHGGVSATAILIHGFGANSQSWDALARRLAQDGMRIVAPDLPGHGRTKGDVARVSDMVPTLSDFMEATAPGANQLVGHSMGAIAATWLAARAGAAVASLTLLAPAGLGADIDGTFLRGMAEATTPGAVAHLLRRLTSRPREHSPGELQSIATELARGRLAGLAADLARGSTQSIDLTGDLERLSIPSRVIVGIADAILPWTQVAALPPGVAVHIVRDAGHMIHWDEPRIVAELLRTANY